MKIDVTDALAQGPFAGPFEAETDVEIVIGGDRVVRVNVDGINRYRIRLGSDAKASIRDSTGTLGLPVITTPARASAWCRP